MKTNTVRNHRLGTIRLAETLRIVTVIARQGQRHLFGQIHLKDEIEIIILKTKKN